MPVNRIIGEEHREPVRQIALVAHLELDIEILHAWDRGERGASFSEECLGFGGP
jgi:hypothetical protein